MEAKSVLEKFRQHRDLLKNVRVNMATPRLKGMWNFLYRQIETQTIIFRILPVNHIVAKANPDKPVEAETYEEVVGIGLYIMKQCSETKKHITEIIHDLGIGQREPKPTRQDYVDDAMSGYINPALDYVEERIETLTKTEMEEKDRKSIAGQARADVKMGARVKAEVIKGKHKDVVPSDETADQPTLEEASIGGYSIPDQATLHDSLGFEPYTTAISEFLSHEDTKPPLTLSIEGEWGSGKSSFMLQLAEKLRGQGALFVRFSPWRHDAEESLWAAFAESFLEQIRRSRFPVRRWIGDFFLFWRRFSWKDGWLDVLRAIAIWGVSLCGVVTVIILLWVRGFGWFAAFAEEFVGAEQEEARAILVKFLQQVFGWGGVAGSLAITVGLFQKVKKYARNPMEINLKRYIKCPDYEERVAFVEHFHNDFEKIVSAYGGNKNVYVFIDDLDRCVPPKAADLIQAINLMISDNPRLIFIIGMDREKVAAGLAAKHKELVDYIDGGISDADEDQAKRRLDNREVVRYGYSFIEKFVQLPFVIPRPTESDIRNLLKEMAQTSNKRQEVEEGPEEDVRGGEYGKSRKGAKASTAEEVGSERVEERRRMLDVKLGGDSPKVREIVLMVAPVFDYNPRRVKQFINLFRLRVYIASETGLFDILAGETQFNRLTLEQLGKFVAISMVWPSLISDLDKEPDLLKGLSRASGDDIGKESRYVKQWFKNKRLMSLVDFVPKDKGDEKESLKGTKYNLLYMDVKKLLEISPKVSRIEIPPEQETYTTQEKYKAFYSELLDRIKEKHPEIKRKKALPQNWLTLPIGHAYIHLEWAFHGRPRSWFEVGLHFEKSSLEKNRQLHDYFLDIKKELERELGGLELTFQCPWGARWARIYASKQGGEMTDELKDWAVKTALKFYDVFKPRLDKFIRSKKG